MLWQNGKHLAGHNIKHCSVYPHRRLAPKADAENKAVEQQGLPLTVLSKDLIKPQN